MANDILAAKGCLHNANKPTLFYQDIPLLTEIFKLCYEDYVNRPPLEHHPFRDVLRLLMEDHIEPICQQSAHYDAKYKIYFDLFKQHNTIDFETQLSNIPMLAFNLANLVSCAVESYKALNYPWREYDAFLELLSKLFNNDTIIQSSKYRQAYILLVQLQQKLSENFLIYY